MAENKNNFDIIVVGAGPAGIIAAGRAAELGAKVAILEKNKKPGKKLILTGNGRCNITNAEFDLRKLVKNYGEKGKFLFHAFSVFGPKETVRFFEKLGVATKKEEGGKIFPISGKSGDVLNALISYLRTNKVSIIYDAEVVGVKKLNRKIEKLKLKNGEVSASNYIFCTGGKSYQKTGSTGDGFLWARDLGHFIEEPFPALSPIKIKEKWVSRIQGLSLCNIEAAIFQDGKKTFSESGDCLFTHFGLSGPMILNISKKVGELLKNGEVSISIDLRPDLNIVELDEELQRGFKKHHNKSLNNFLAELFPRKLVYVIVGLLGISPEKKINIITKEERNNLVRTFKNIKLTVSGVLGFDVAMVTSGGISLREINDKTMRSKVIDNLFFAGEIIDADGPTGGFNLQICWSTGYLAGESAAK